MRYRSFDSFTHVNQQLEQWMSDVADKRVLRQFKETPEQRFELEKSALQPLPATDFDTSYFDIRTYLGTAILKLGATVTACLKSCVDTLSQYGSRWMTNCGSTVMSN